MMFARQSGPHRRPPGRLAAGRHAHFAAALAAAAGLAFDYLTPLGVAAGLIYTGVVLCALWAEKPSAAYLYAAIASALTVLGYVLAPHPAADAWITLTNRGLTILALWLLAFIVFRQKTIQAAQEQQQSELSAIQEKTVDGMITIDTSGNILSYNRACKHIFGYSTEEAVGQNVKLLMPDPDHSAHDSYLHNYLRTGQKMIIGVGREVRGRRKDGSTFPLHLSVSEVRVGGIVLFSGIVRDISEQKRAEKEREAFIEELSRSNRDLDGFAYVASHDLRAPLRVIDNTASWLEEDLAKVMNEDSRENLQLLRSRVRRMDRLLDDLLEYSRIGRADSTQHQQPVPGSKVIQDALMLVNAPAGFTIRIDPAFQNIEIPKMPLIQIFANLVSNAVKHSETGTGTVDVTLEEQDSHWAFSVADDGPGIAPKYHDQIFKMFQTLKSRDQVEGSGMGLSIVQKHVQHVGGTVTLRSTPGEGSDFRFTWPKQQRNAKDED